MKLQLADIYKDKPDARDVAEELRHCVECGAANSVCATLQLLNDENDSPRGRNRLIRNILESGKAPSPEAVKHIDQCLSCNACTATCLAQVDFRRVMDLTREIVEETYQRPMADRLFRLLVKRVLPNPGLFRVALVLGRLAAPFSALLPGRLKGLVKQAGTSVSAARWSALPTAKSQAVEGNVAILDGCVNSVLGADINAATERVMTRLGHRVIPVNNGCCGALNFHMGDRDAALSHARKLLGHWKAAEVEQGPLTAIAVNASGCGSMVKDFAHLFKGEQEYDEAVRFAGLARDVSELITAEKLSQHVVSLDLERWRRVAWHPPCSLQHVQKVRTEPETLLRMCGFTLTSFRERDLCCGSAGSYSILQPEVSGQIRNRKVSAIEESRPDVIASANIGCIQQIASGTQVPVVHLIELLDWATGGPKPKGLEGGARG